MAFNVNMFSYPEVLCQGLVPVLMAFEEQKFLFFFSEVLLEGMKMFK